MDGIIGPNVFQLWPVEPAMIGSTTDTPFGFRGLGTRTPLGTRETGSKGGGSTNRALRRLALVSRERENQKEGPRGQTTDRQTRTEHTSCIHHVTSLMVTSHDVLMTSLIVRRWISPRATTCHNINHHDSCPCSLMTWGEARETAHRRAGGADCLRRSPPPATCPTLELWASCWCLVGSIRRVETPSRRVSAP